MFLPFSLLKFWYIEAPLEIIGFFSSLNNYFMQLFALSVCIKTFFKPLKNEYREGLVVFTRVMGMIIKSFLITIDLFILFVLIAFESIVILSFLGFPILTVIVLFL